jgi:putative CocE/NonD family hydrolase
MAGRNRKFDFAEDFLTEIDRHTLDDSYWRGKQTALERINAPALICASWSDQGLHTRGSFEAFERIGSPEKWLYTHGRKKWETYYEAEAVAMQKRFLDHYLKGQDNGWSATPRVRLEVRRAYYRQDVRHEAHWPLPDACFVPLYLDADQAPFVSRRLQARRTSIMTRHAAKRRFRFVLLKPWSSPARQSCMSGSALQMAMISTCSSC